MYTIRIELMSDLCAASGDGYASVIDTDITTDSSGIPFIPARRLKGCLRNAAVYIGSKLTDDIFGTPGSVNGGSLRISDAQLDCADELSHELSGTSLPPAAVTDLFSSTYASTAISDDGRAKDNSLRFIRAVDRHAPWDEDSSLVFEAAADIDDKYAEELGRICKALRHIGSKRTRGFGAVRCSLVRSADEKKQGIGIPEDIAPDKRYILEYAVRLDECVMLPGQSSDETMDHISGQAVLGMLAGEYLKIPGNTAQSEEFDRLFLGGGVSYSPLYISDSKLNEYIPAPAVFGKIKDEKGTIVDRSVKENLELRPKPLKKGCLSADMKLLSADTEIIYHNSISNKKGLYTQLCLSRGQYFRGSITASGDDMKLIAGLLGSCDISVGRSRTAQYSHCTLAASRISRCEDKTIHVKPGDTLMYIFETDTVIRDEYGNISPNAESVVKALEIPGEPAPSSVLKYTTLRGFLSVMRLKKQHIRAVAAGSVILAEAEKECDVEARRTIGEKQHEGCGRIRVCKKGSYASIYSKPLAFDSTGDAGTSEKAEKIRSMLSAVEERENMRNAAIRYIREKRDVFSPKSATGKPDTWNPAFIGRVSLMAEEAKDSIDFRSRIRSIKNPAKRRAAENLYTYSHANHYDWKLQREYIMLILRLGRYNYITLQKSGSGKNTGKRGAGA